MGTTYLKILNGGFKCPKGLKLWQVGLLNMGSYLKRIRMGVSILVKDGD